MGFGVVWERSKKWNGNGYGGVGKREEVKGGNVECFLRIEVLLGGFEEIVSEFCLLWGKFVLGL